jgi:ParB-like chromosome segregation protein Spo0J
VYAPEYAPRGAEIEQLGLERPPKLVSRCLDELRPHPSYVRLALSPSAGQFSGLAVIGELAFREPIVITSNGLIVDGYARFELAQRQGRATVLCLEYELSEEEALRWLIQRHRPSKGLSACNRALLALDLEPSLQETARANQQWGGQNKGSSSLTEAQTLNVRSEIAAAAGVSPGTLDKVRKVKSADPEIQEATRAEEISIHMASQWCRLSAHQQLKKLEEHRGRKGTNLTSRRLIQKHARRLAPTQLIPWSLGDVLGPFVPKRSPALDSIVVAEIDAQGSIAYFTKNALRTLSSMEETNGRSELTKTDLGGITRCLGSTGDSLDSP